MDRSRIARRLGGPTARRRRHRLVALAGAGLLAIAGVLIFVVDGDDDDGFDAQAGETCVAYGERVQEEFALSFPGGGPPSNEAAAEYLSHAFADTMDELVAELRALEPPADAGVAIDALDARIQEIRATPAEFVDEDPFAEVAGAFDEIGLSDCGSEFFPDPE